MLKVFRKKTGHYFTNSYLLVDSATGKSAIIDPASFNGYYEEFLRENNGLSPEYILLTHGHFDHICGVSHIKERFGGEILIHENDAECLMSEDESLTSLAEGFELVPCKADRLLSDGDEIVLGETVIRVKHTPGHTRGSVIYITDGYIFSGDTLFRESMGRTDLPGGSTRALFASLRAIGEMEGEYVIFPGHGEETSLTHEKRNNRYLRSKERMSEQSV